MFNGYNMMGDGLVVYDAYFWVVAIFASMAYSREFGKQNDLLTLNL